MNLKRLFPIIMPWQRQKPSLVIHSDDWGATRMSSEAIRKTLDEHQLINASDPYARFDTLASAEDLQALFEVLTSVKDARGNYAVLTPNVIMANPDFQRIKDIEYNQYFFEPLTVTFEKFNNSNALELWKEGMGHGIFMPQYHGREHVNIKPWLEHLRNGHEGVIKAFDYQVFGVNFVNLGLRKKNFQAAWDFYDKKDETSVVDSILEGYDMFENYFGFRSKTAIAPSYTWTKKMQIELKAKGVEAMQGIIVQKRPPSSSTAYNKKYHIRHSGSYQMRNVFFEPSLMGKNNVVEHALKRISDAFTMGHPAIVSAHRLNFVGGLSLRNRKENLKLLHELLIRVKKRWPDIEFRGAQDLLKSNRLLSSQR